MNHSPPPQPGSTPQPGWAPSDYYAQGIPHRRLNIPGLFSILCIGFNILWTLILPFIVFSGVLERHLTYAPWLHLPTYFFTIAAIVFGAIGAPKANTRMRWGAIGGLVAGLASALDIAAGALGATLVMAG